MTVLESKKSSLLLINNTDFYTIVFFLNLQEFIEFEQPLMYDKTMKWKQTMMERTFWRIGR
ncbi:hypothetical protein B5E64_03395 [Drancourtella sp. An12]|nr:hypothetical protein B5E64_03395 [Drancourtella sp. An12]